jgi:aryl-alcohol dehydrogenase-like predicted oxidoreductase
MLAMKMRSIGSLEATLAGLGCANFGWWLDEPQSHAIVHAALDAGITFFDCADEYGEGLCEEYLGRALGARRRDVTLITKFAGAKPSDGTPPGSARWVQHSCEQSLRRLGTDWIDLYMLHHPDPTTPIGETLEALQKLQNAGKIREIGCSNMTAPEIRDAADAAASLGMTGFRTLECGYSLLDRTAELGVVPLCNELGMPVLPYFPLASGMLTGKYRRGENTATQGRMAKDLQGQKVRDFFPALFSDACFGVVEALEKYAHDHGHSLADLALAWVASRPWVGSVIAGASSPDHIARNVAAIGWQLTDAQQSEVAAITTTEYAFTWLHGAPAYTSPPPGTMVDTAARVDSVMPGVLDNKVTAAE